MHGREPCLGEPVSNVAGQREEAAPAGQREERHRDAATPARLAQGRRVAMSQRSDELRTAQKRAVDLLQLLSQLQLQRFKGWGIDASHEWCRRDPPTHGVFAPVTLFATGREMANFCTLRFMPNTTTPPRRGRPNRHPMDVLFTRLWFFVVKARSGLPSAYAIELELERHLVRQSADGQWRPRKWDAYEAGRRVPSRWRNRTGSIEIAEERFPGTARYLESPLRTLLRKPAVTLRWVDDQLLALPAVLVNLLFEDQPAASTLAPRLRDFDRVRARQLAALGGFDGLVAAVLLMKRAELVPSPDTRGMAWEAYLQARARVRTWPEVAPVAAELFQAIEASFPYWLYPRADEDVDAIPYVETPRSDAGAVDSGEGLARGRLARSILALDRQLVEHYLLESGKRPASLQCRV